MKRILQLIFLISLVLTSYGQNSSKQFSFSVFGGKNEYAGDMGSAILKCNKAFYPAYGLGLGINLSPSFDLGLQGSWGEYGFMEDAEFKVFHTQKQHFLGEKTDLSLLLSYKLNNGLIMDEESRLAPFIAVGAGTAFYSGDRINKNNIDFILPVGAGLKLVINDYLALKYQFLYNFTNGDKVDFIVERAKDRFAAHSFGLVFSFGGPQDSDNDGIADKLDKCPNTPSGVQVDMNGCPVDGDNDGIPDFQDKCPSLAGVAAFGGCPDTDGDGVQDSEDKCPGVAGLAAFKGCPDTDGDGIQDSEDKCPSIKGTAATNGCPDADGDGIIDSEDRCPAAKGEMALKGCPDRDKDGIADIDDRCPDVAGIPENKGCPEIKAETKKVFEQALRGIQFESGKDVIKPVSFPILDQVVKVMVENPEYNLEINGHTDDVGKDEANLILSQKRAEAVKKYLVNKGIGEGRLKATGFGETQPVADNKTAAGKAQNRRVEFKVIF